MRINKSLIDKNSNLKDEIKKLKDEISFSMIFFYFLIFFNKEKDVITVSQN